MCDDKTKGGGSGAAALCVTSATKQTRYQKLRLRLIKRDGLACHWCGKAMIMDVLDDWGISIERIVPRSKGGTYRLDNLRLAHRWCNSHRGNGDAPPPSGPPSV